MRHLEAVIIGVLGNAYVSTLNPQYLETIKMDKVLPAQIPFLSNPPLVEDLPPTLEGNRALTLNNTGFVFYILTPLDERFIKEEACPQKNLLEIGSSFSNVVLEALKNGVGFYTAIDLSQEHLDILARRIEQELGEKLLQSIKLIAAKAPDQLPFAKDQYDAILMDKVLHFMTPEEIEQCILWCREALKENGKIYIMTTSPHNIGFSQELVSRYIQKSKQGDIYAGFFEDVTPYLKINALTQEHPLGGSPESMTVFSRNDLEKLFEHHGFETQESYSLIFTKGSKGYFWRRVKDEEGDAVCAIFVKK